MFDAHTEYSFKGPVGSLLKGVVATAALALFLYDGTSYLQGNGTTICNAVRLNFLTKSSEFFRGTFAN